jgi:hypothetical protein
MNRDPRMTFRIGPHSERPGEDMVEVYINGIFAAAIYPASNGNGVHVVSKYMHDLPMPTPGMPPGTMIFLELPEEKSSNGHPDR